MKKKSVRTIIQFEKLRGQNEFLEMLNSTKVLKRAAERLENIFWFGILEEMDKSMELLRLVFIFILDFWLANTFLRSPTPSSQLPIRVDSLENRKRFQIGFKSNLKMPHKRKNEKLKKFSSQEIDKRIESLIPMDIWLYKYAKRLFQARWNFFKTGIYIRPSYPPFPGI